MKKDFNNLAVGDVVLDQNGDKRVVLAVCDRCLNISEADDFDEYEFSATRGHLIRYGYTIKQPERNVEDEVADLIGNYVHKYATTEIEMDKFLHSFYSELKEIIGK